MSIKGNMLRMGLDSDGSNIEAFQGSLTANTSVNATTFVKGTTGIIGGSFSIASLAAIGLGGKSVTLADGGTLTLKAATAALLIVAQQGASGEHGIVVIDAAGTVKSIATASADFALTNASSKLCVYKGAGTAAIIENNLGDSYVFDVYYFTIGGA